MRDLCLCHGCGDVCGIGGSGLAACPGSGRVWWCYVCVCCEPGLFVLMAGPGVVYGARQIHAHLRCTQCSIMLHLIDICFLTCIYPWQISEIQTFLCVVAGPGLVSKSPAFMMNIASHLAGLHGRLALTNGNRSPIAWGEWGRHNLHRVCQIDVTAPPFVCYVSSTACRLCRLELFSVSISVSLLQ